MVESGTCYHLTGDTPSVRPFGLPAPPSGSRVQPPLKGEGGASRRRGQERYAEYHLECTKANSYRPAPSAPERGAAAAAAEGCGKRLRFCQGLGESVQSTTHILRIRLGFYKTSTAYRETPQAGPLGLPAQLCIKQLYAALWAATPAKPFRGAFLAAPFGGGAPRSESR